MKNPDKPLMLPVCAITAKVGTIEIPINAFCSLLFLYLKFSVTLALFLQGNNSYAKYVLKKTPSLPLCQYMYYPKSIGCVREIKEENVFLY